jgi:hypothetical protein
MLCFLLLNTICFVGNNFVGFLPDLTKLVHLSVFDGSNNQFEGNIFSIFYSLSQKRFPNNLKVLHLSNNNITGSFSEKKCFNFQPSIIDLSGNNLGTMSDSSLKFLFCFCFGNEHASLDLSRNPQFSSALPECLLNMNNTKQLTRVDIDVRFTGLRGNSSIQLYQNIKRHDYVTLRSYNHTYTSTTPPWRIPQIIKRANYYSHMLCPLFKIWQLDPAYYNHSLCVIFILFGVLLFNLFSPRCKCFEGYCWRNSECADATLSLTHYNCSGSIYSQTVTTAPGYFPLQLSGNGNEAVTAENVEPLQRCYLDDACPPSSVVGNEMSATSAKYNCENGYEDRLCSRCISGRFRDGYECSRCQWYHKALLSWVWVVATIAFVL